MTTPSTLARLAKELSGYAVHPATCGLRRFDRVKPPTCTCGLTALQQQLAEELAKGEVDELA